MEEITIEDVLQDFQIMLVEFDYDKYRKATKDFDWKQQLQVSNYVVTLQSTCKLLKETYNYQEIYDMTIYLSNYCKVKYADKDIDKFLDEFRKDIEPLVKKGKELYELARKEQYV